MRLPKIALLDPDMTVSMPPKLTSKFGLSHGETLAIMAGPVMRFNTMACVDRIPVFFEGADAHDTIR